MRARAEDEVRAICASGIADLVLFAYEVSRFCAQRGIPLAARGSATSSLVIWALGLVDLCPLDYALDGRMFVHDDREDLPDLDLEVSSVHGGAVSAFVQQGPTWRTSYIAPGLPGRDLLDESDSAHTWRAGTCQYAAGASAQLGMLSPRDPRQGVHVAGPQVLQNQVGNARSGGRGQKSTMTRRPTLLSRRAGADPRSCLVAEMCRPSSAPRTDSPHALTFRGRPGWYCRRPPCYRRLGTG